MNITPENITIAKTLRDAIGGLPRIQRYWDQTETYWVDIFSSVDRPCPGYTSYGTIGLSDTHIGYTVQEHPLRVELVRACHSAFTHYPNILAGCAIRIMGEHFACYPGAIIPDLIQPYYPASAMKHLLLAPLFMWTEHLNTLEFPSKIVTWLFATPIADSELAYAQTHTATELTEQLERHRIDVYDLCRQAISFS